MTLNVLDVLVGVRRAAGSGITGIFTTGTKEKISSEQYSRVEENASMTSGVTWADWLETVEG